MANFTASSSPNVDVSVPWEAWEIWRLMGHDKRSASLLGESVKPLDDVEWADRIGCPAFMASVALRVLRDMGLIDEAPRG